MRVGPIVPNPTPEQRRKIHDMICDRKIAYWKRKYAENVAARNSAIYGVKLYVYECPWCGDFHLTRRDPATWRKED